MTNPIWSFDELIIALDFYLEQKHKKPLRSDGTRPFYVPSQKSPEIAALSQQLNAMYEKTDKPKPDKYRNANGVYMKVSNFLTLDSEYSGKGLGNYSKEQKEVWDTYANAPKERQKVLRAIDAHLKSGDFDLSDYNPDEPGFVEAREGRILSSSHTRRERDGSVVRRKKKWFLDKYNTLACEACTFDFEKTYGARGHGYIECHHLIALSDMDPDGKHTTHLKDLALLCSNCHRMIHRQRPWLSMDELEKTLRTNTD